MIETKLLEIRDEGTLIPMMAVRVISDSDDPQDHDWLIRRSGWGENNEGIYLFAMHGKGSCHYDEYDWGSEGARTIKAAHAYIRENYADLDDAQVIDVQFINGETPRPKSSERMVMPDE